MKKTILAVTMAASVLALSACSDKNADEDILVKSKAGNVTKSELYNEMKEAQGEQTLQLLVLEKVLEDKYKVSDKDVSAEIQNMKDQLGDQFDAYIAQQGQTEDSLKKVVRLNLLQEAALSDGIEVTDEEIAQVTEWKNTELNARHVLVADEETANEVKKKLADGADFAKIAKEYSTEELAQTSGGDLGWFGYGQMDPAFQKAAYELKENTISEPVQSSHGFHIIEVTEKRELKEGKVTDKDKDAIRKEIQLEKVDQSEIIAKISKLMKKADVKVQDKDLKSALDIFLKDNSKKTEEGK